MTHSPCFARAGTQADRTLARSAYLLLKNGFVESFSASVISPWAFAIAANSSARIGLHSSVISCFSIGSVSFMFFQFHEKLSVVGWFKAHFLDSLALHFSLWTSPRIPSSDPQAYLVNWSRYGIRSALHFGHVTMYSNGYCIGIDLLDIT